MWIVDKFTKNQTISQIRLSDAKQISSTYLYSLSTDKSLKYFDKIIFVGSSKDTYAPLESAIVQPSPRMQSLSHCKKVVKMQSNMLQHLQNKCFIRVNVNTRSDGKTMDSYLGREAHIQFIDNAEVLKMLINRYF